MFSNKATKPVLLSKWPIIFLSSNKFHQVCPSHLSLSKFIESLTFYCFQERHTVRTVSSHITFGIQAFEVCVCLGFCFSWSLCSFAGFWFLLSFFVTRQPKVNYPHLKIKYILPTSETLQGWNLAQGSSSISPGISQLWVSPLEFQEYPWPEQTGVHHGQSAACALSAERQEIHWQFLFLSCTEQFCITAIFRSIHKMKITNFILKTSKLLSISPSTIAEEAFSSPDHKV